MAAARPGRVPAQAEPPQDPPDSHGHGGAPRPAAAAPAKDRRGGRASRLTAAPVGSGTHNLGVLGACLVVGAIGWLWVFGLGVAVFGMSALTASAPLLGVVGAALGAYTLVAVSLGFLIGQIGLGENAAHAIANIGGMALSFLGGTWVPIEWLPDAVARAARLTPGYWVDQALSEAYAATSTSAEALLPLLADCGICALFALAILSVAMGVRRTRARASL